MNTRNMSEEDQMSCDTLEVQAQLPNSSGKTVTEGSKLNDADPTQKTTETDKDKNFEEMTEKNYEVEKMSENGSDASRTSNLKENVEEKISLESSTKDGENAYDYELISGQYYYSDKSSGKRYRYDKNVEEWIEVTMDMETENNFEQAGEPTITDCQVVDGIQSDTNTEHKGEYTTTTDSEGRTYYYADDQYLCQDREGNVFYLNEKNEWKPWAEKDNVLSSESSKWFFCQGDSTFYRDNVSGVVYRLDKENNKWEKYEGKLKKKRPLIDEEEFDTDEDDSDGESGGGLVPPGAKEDPNISYDGTTYTKVDPVDKVVYEWDTERRAWFPKLDEDFMATYQLSYGFNPDGTVNENPLKFDDENEEEEEIKAAEELKRKLENEKAKATKKKLTWFQMDETRNTKVYVNNLPDSMTENSFVTLMQKCGMIMLDEQTSRPKVKLYKDEEGNFKGDALCTYIKVESVKLAEQILDGYQVGNMKIHVEQAKFQQKGEYNPKLKPRKKGKKELERLKKKQEKLFDWRPEPMRGQRKKWENTVVIRNVFDPKEFEVAMDKILDHKEAMRSQASNFGKIKKLELFDLHPEGVVQVTFEEVESADMCVATLHKRMYAGRTLYVTTWDGKEKFKIEETAAEREERIRKWNEFLETEATTSK
uniref:17S U2 SnRNP complex component HTATSF1 n=1 Tax=Scylla olivacea TaxID=85551 RepID=A0A0P4WFG7_SCYOL